MTFQHFLNGATRVSPLAIAAGGRPPPGHGCCRAGAHGRARGCPPIEAGGSPERCRSLTRRVPSRNPGRAFLGSRGVSGLTGGSSRCGSPIVRVLRACDSSAAIGPPTGGQRMSSNEGILSAVSRIAEIASQATNEIRSRITTPTTWPRGTTRRRSSVHPGGCRTASDGLAASRHRARVAWWAKRRWGVPLRAGIRRAAASGQRTGFRSCQSGTACTSRAGRDSPRPARSPSTRRPRP